MNTFQKILENLTMQNQELYLLQCIETEHYYLIYPSDKIGVPEDCPPLTFDKSSGKAVSYAQAEDDCILCGLPVPEAYRTYRSLVLERMQKQLTADGTSTLDSWMLNGCMDLLINSDCLPSGLSQLYAVFHYLVAMIVAYSDDSARESISALAQEPSVQEFLALPWPQKLETAEEFNYEPALVQTLEDASYQIQDLALAYRREQKLRQEDFAQAKETYQTQLEQVLEQWDALIQDPFADQAWLQEKLQWIQKQTEQEIAFCENRSDTISERMQDLLLWDPDSQADLQSGDVLPLPSFEEIFGDLQTGPQ